jgi:hypothetical protein
MIDALGPEFLQKASSCWIAGGAPNIKKRETDAFANNFHRASQNVHIFHIAQLYPTIGGCLHQSSSCPSTEKDAEDAARFFRVGKTYLPFTIHQPLIKTLQNG